jgi:hypothetical protein
LTGGVEIVPRRSRRAAGVDGVFGRFGSSSTARFCRGKSSGHRSEGAHEGEEEREAREGVRGCSTASLPKEIDGGLHDFRRGISPRWWRLWFGSQREIGEGEKGLNWEGFKGSGSYWGEVIADRFNFQEGEREIRGEEGADM